MTGDRLGPFPSVEEKEPNNDSIKAQPIALNSTVHGTIGSEDVDFFSVQAKKDQRLSVEIEGARLGRTMFDPIITLQSADGRTLVASDDTPLLGHDGFVSLLAPEPAAQEGFARLAESLSSGGFIARIPKYEFCVDQSLC